MCDIFLPKIRLFQIPKIFKIPDDDPASHLLRHLDKYLQRNDSETIKTLRNINAFTLGLKREDFDNEAKVNDFLKGIVVSLSYGIFRSTFKQLTPYPHLAYVSGVSGSDPCWSMVTLENRSPFIPKR